MKRPGQPVNPRLYCQNITIVSALIVGMVAFSNYTLAQQTGITAIYTDFNGYWSSSSSAISPVKPDNSHNLVGFRWNGHTYSTGVNDALLTTNGVSFTPMQFQAFPVRQISLAGTSALPALGQLKDGVDNGASVPPPFSLPPNVSYFLTDGVNGLDIGTGVANIPSGTLLFDFGSIIDISQIGDGLPDILVSQIADPSATLDSIYFTDAGGNVVGNKIAINHTSSSIPAVGRWVADFYNANGTLTAGFTKTERMLRVWGADISAFGINSTNYTEAITLRYRLNGTSDPAFLAFNRAIIQVTSANNDVAYTLVNAPVTIDILANDQPFNAINKASVQVTSAPANGSISVNSVTGAITYTPNAGFSGIDHFVYQVCNNNSTPQCDEADVTIYVGNADLAVTQTADILAPALLSQVSFEIRAVNHGLSNAHGVRVDDLLPSGFSFISASAGTGSYNNTTGVWTIGALNNGQEAVLTITANVNATGSYTNRAIISGSLFDPNNDNDTTTLTLSPVPASSDLEVVKTVNKHTARADSSVVFSITARNNGPSLATSVLVTDLLPSGYSLQQATAPAGTSYNSVNGIWTIGSLAKDSVKTLQIETIVHATGDHTNTAVISGAHADANSSNNSSTATVTPAVGIPVFHSGSSSVICQSDNTVHYTAEATNQSGMTYSILPDTAGHINVSTGNVTWNSNFYGEAIITATATGIDGPVSSQHTVMVNPAATAPVFAAGGSSHRCQGTGMQSYTASSAHTTAMSYQLSPADAGTIDAATGTVTWDAAFSGTAYIQATATGCSGSVHSTHTVTVQATPSAQLAYESTSFCRTGLAAVFENTGSSNGTFSSGAGLFINSHTGGIDLGQSTAGTYTIYYNYADGSCPGQSGTTITILPDPALQITNPDAVCYYDAADITHSQVTAGSSPGLVYTYFMDAGTLLSLANPSAINTAGMYYIKGTNADGCSTIGAVTVSIEEPDATTISYAQSSFCNTGTATVIIHGITGGVFSAPAGLSISAATGEIDLDNSTPGSYTIQYQYQSNNCTGTVYTDVSVYKPGLVITDPSPVCAPHSVDLTATAVTAGSDNGLTFGYFTDAAATTALTSPSQVATGGTYYIRGHNAAGCASDVEPVIVVIQDQPVLSVDAPSQPVCRGETVQLMASGSVANIVWAGYEEGGSTINVEPAATTSFRAVATSSEGCTTETSVTVTVSNFRLSLLASPGSVTSGKPVNFQTSGTEAYNVIAWQPAASFTNTSATAQTIIVSDTTRTFQVIAQSAGGCLDTAQVTLSIDPNTSDIFIPNAFTPNNDGKNDIFKVYGSSLKAVEMRIYSQWGTLVYETRDNQAGWNGKSGNQPQPVGTYLYVIKITLTNSDSFIRKGSLSLIR